MPPQMYFVLDNHPKLKSILEKQTLNEKLFVHDHKNIHYDNIAMSVSELSLMYSLVLYCFTKL